LSGSSQTFIGSSITGIQLTFTSSSGTVDWILAAWITENYTPAWYLWSWDGCSLHAFDIEYDVGQPLHSTELCFDPYTPTAYIAGIQTVTAFGISEQNITQLNSFYFDQLGK
jgi:hypothetical protein